MVKRLIICLFACLLLLSPLLFLLLSVLILDRRILGRNCVHLSLWSLVFRRLFIAGVITDFISLFFAVVRAVANNIIIPI